MICYTYRLFDSVSAVMLAARRVEKQGITCKIVPIPREFSSDCGVCLRTDYEEENIITRLLGGALTSGATIHRKKMVV